MKNIDSGIAISHFAFAMNAQGFNAAQETLRKLKVTFDPPGEVEIGKAIWSSHPDGH